MEKIRGAHAQLFRFVSSVQTEELCRVAELLSHVFLCQKMTGFSLHREIADMYIFWGLITTQPACTLQ